MLERGLSAYFDGINFLALFLHIIPKLNILLTFLEALCIYIVFWVIIPTFLMKPNAQSIPSGQKNGFFDEKSGQAVSVTTYLNTHEGHTNALFFAQ